MNAVSSELETRQVVFVNVKRAKYTQNNTELSNLNHSREPRKSQHFHLDPPLEQLLAGGLFQPPSPPRPTFSPDVRCKEL
ncbi:MAG: hypothetical protein GY820_30165 [Gammaproteobacteria bacterium]|nr:hypothetical protein [Gammaproteobacteria bacterium]